MKFCGVRRCVDAGVLAGPNGYLQGNSSEGHHSDTGHHLALTWNTCRWVESGESGKTSIYRFPDVGPGCDPLNESSKNLGGKK